MIDIELLRADTEAVAANLKRRGVASSTVDAVYELDARWRRLQQQVDERRAQQNASNEGIAAAQGEEKKQLIVTAKEASAALTTKEQELAMVAQERLAAWRGLPNLLREGVPEGDETHSKLVAESTTPVPTADGWNDYLTLLGGDVDVERAVKVSGSRFAYLLGDVARLEFGLVSFALDQLRAAGFMPVVPPVLIKEEAMRGMGYLDHEGDEIYRTQDDLYLVGTSEQSIGPMHMNEILEAAALPRRYVGFSTCFRREAGSHGKDVRGILRVHQFDKVEMFSITTPEAADEEHELILSQQRALMDALELPYRVMNMASGDLGAPAAKKYDIETWIPSEGRFRETHSTSNTTDYQARRLNIRLKTAAGTVTPHMLNGTAFAIGRILIALVENHQQPDGSIRIPAVLHPYLPFTVIANYIPRK